MNKESLVKEQVVYQSIGEQISHELASKMVKDHCDKFSAEESHSFFIGKDILEKTFAQPGCVGIRFYEALNEIGQKTLVSIGIDSNGKNILKLTSVNEHGKIAVTEGLVWDRILTTSGNTTDNPPYVVD
jgi:hypothetical protein